MIQKKSALSRREVELRGVGVFYNVSNVLRSVVSEVVFNSKPLDKSIESFFKSHSHIDSYEKEDLYRLFTFVVRYWITIHEIYKLQYSSRNVDFKEILHIQDILARWYRGKLVCKGNYEKQVIESFKKVENCGNIKESYPEWLYNKILVEGGSEAVKTIRCLNEIPPIVIRTNTLKSSTRELKNKLVSKGKLVSEVEGYTDALKVNKYFNLFSSDEFRNGLFEQQDAGSQFIAPFLEVEPGMRIIDACAGNGGKTLHLSCLTGNKGKILALDNAAYKLETLNRRARRAGSQNIETRPIDSTKVFKRLSGSADRLLLDVPCSGTGVLKRNPDIKYHLTEEKLKNINLLQSDILDKYSGMAAIGGILVYSTCSILESENRTQVNKFLERKQGAFELLSDRNISPLDGYDGFYVAKIKRVK